MKGKELGLPNMNCHIYC